jgi:hypothetical protein
MWTVIYFLSLDTQESEQSYMFYLDTKESEQSYIFVFRRPGKWPVTIATQESEQSSIFCL